MINSRSVLELRDDARLKALEWQQNCADIGIKVIFTSTFRDSEYQNYLFDQGRKNNQKIVTNAKAGESKHNHRIAWDFCIMNGKKCDWNNLEAFVMAGKVAEKLGLKWAGRWQGKLKEMAHIEL